MCGTVHTGTVRTIKNQIFSISKLYYRYLVSYVHNKNIEFLPLVYHLPIHRRNFRPSDRFNFPDFHGDFKKKLQTKTLLLVPQDTTHAPCACPGAELQEASSTDYHSSHKSTKVTLLASIMFYDISYDFVFFFSIMCTVPYGTVQFCSVMIYYHFYCTEYNNVWALWEEINPLHIFIISVIRQSNTISTYRCT